MKVKNYEIFNSINSLQKISEMNLPIMVAYKIKKNIDIIDKQIKIINNCRNDIIKKYGKEIDGNYSINDDDHESIQMFSKEFDEILQIEEEINIDKININELGDIQLSVYDLNSLLFMISVDE